MRLFHLVVITMLLSPAGLAAEEVKAPKDAAVAVLQDSSLSPFARAEKLQAMTNTSPDSAEVWAAYGEALEATGDTERALLAFKKSTELDPGNFAPWMRLGLLYKRGAPEPNLKGAEDAFRKALEKGAPKAKALNELGVSMALQGHMSDAIVAWEDAVKEDPGWGALYNNLMKAGSATGNEKLMARYLDAAIKADRFEEAAVLQYGEYLRKKDKPGKAADVYEKALAVYPKNTRIRYYYGSALGADGEAKGAARELAEARRLSLEANEGNDVAQSVDFEMFKIDHPDDEKKLQKAREQIFQVKATTYSEMDRKALNKALKTLDDLTAKHPDFWNIYFLRGTANRRLDNREAARRDFERVRQLFPNEPNATMELALLSRDEERFAEAATLADSATTNAPKDPLFAMNAGFIYIEAGMCDKAWEQYRRTARLVGAQNAGPLLDELQIRCKQAATVEQP